MIFLALGLILIVLGLVVAFWRCDRAEVAAEKAYWENLRAEVLRGPPWP